MREQGYTSRAGSLQSFDGEQHPEGLAQRFEQHPRFLRQRPERGHVALELRLQGRLFALDGLVRELQPAAHLLELTPEVLDTDDGDLLLVLERRLLPEERIHRVDRLSAALTLGPDELAPLGDGAGPAHGARAFARELVEASTELRPERSRALLQTGEGLRVLCDDHVQVAEHPDE